MLRKINKVKVRLGRWTGRLMQCDAMRHRWDWGPIISVPCGRGKVRRSMRILLCKVGNSAWILLDRLSMNVCMYVCTILYIR